MRTSLRAVAVGAALALLLAVVLALLTLWLAPPPIDGVEIAK